MHPYEPRIRSLSRSASRSRSNSPAPRYDSDDSSSSSEPDFDLDQEGDRYSHTSRPITYAARQHTPLDGTAWAGYHAGGNGYSGTRSPRATSPYGYALSVAGQPTRPSPLSQSALHSGSAYYRTYSNLSSPMHPGPFTTHPSSGLRGHCSDSPEFGTVALPAEEGFAPGVPTTTSFPSQAVLLQHFPTAYSPGPNGEPQDPSAFEVELDPMVRSPRQEEGILQLVQLASGFH